MKTLKVKIKSKAKFEEDARKMAQAFDRGEGIKASQGTYFESFEAMRNVLTETRLDVWRTIRDKNPGSISELAKLLGRNFRAVHRDVVALEYLDIIKLEPAKGQRGDVKIPISLVDQMKVTVA